MNATDIRRRSGSTFSLAFLGLPKDQKDALTALYAFCRTVDDVVDETGSAATAIRELGRWRSILDRIDQPSVYDPPLAHELSRALKKFPVQTEDLRWIIDGVEMDLCQFRYRTFEELLSYCDGVASAVGLASMAIFGADRRRTSGYVFATGRALQLTNIIRDVAEDARRGRIYIPVRDMEEAGYREKDLLKSVYDQRFVDLMSRQAVRARACFDAACAELPAEERKQYPAAELMRKTYQTLLARIEHLAFRVFPERIRVPAPRRIAIALSVWVPHFVRAA